MRKNVEYNWFVDDIFLLTANFIGQEVNGFLYFLEVSEFLIGNFFKLGPWLNKLRGVIQSQFKRSSGNNTISTRKKIKTDN